MPIDRFKPFYDRLKPVYRSLWLRGLVICLFFVGNHTWNDVVKAVGLDDHFISFCDRIKPVYRSLWFRALVICLFFVGNLTWNEVGRTFGLDWIARLLLQRGIPISITVILLLWTISLLPWMFYRGAKTLSHNAKVSYIAGICCTLLLYAILAWYSFSLIPGVSPPLITLSLFLSFFQRIDIILISFFQSKRTNSISASQLFSIFMIRITDLLFFPTFAWLVRDILVISFYLFILLLAITITGLIIGFFYEPSHSSNRKSDELHDADARDDAYAMNDAIARMQEKYWEAKAQQERERRE